MPQSYLIGFYILKQKTVRVIGYLNIRRVAILPKGCIYEIQIFVHLARSEIAF